MFFLTQSILILFLFCTQTTLLAPFAVAGITPDLALIFVVYCGFHFQGNGGVAMGFAVGLLQDCLSGGILGVNTLSKSLIGTFFSTLKDKILVEGFVPIFFFLIVASLVDGFIFYLLLVTLLKGSLPGRFLFAELPVYALYNACVGPLCFYFFDIVRKWTVRRFPNAFVRTT